MASPLDMMWDHARKVEVHSLDPDEVMSLAFACRLAEEYGTDPPMNVVAALVLAARICEERDAAREEIAQLRAHLGPIDLGTGQTPGENND